jgi:tetratricopeptide (TPR) repeat protein
MDNNSSSYGVTDTKGDVFGFGISGIGNYVIKGNVIQINNPSREFLMDLNKIQTTLMQISCEKDSEANKYDKSSQELKVMEKRIDRLLEIVKKIDNEREIESRELIAGKLHFSRVDLLLKRAIVLLVEEAQRYWNVVSTDSHINMYKLKHKEAYGLLQEANRIDPYNTEVLLYMAKVECKLNPDNLTKMKRTLTRVQNLLAMPDNDTKIFHLAEATFLLATSSEPIDNELLYDARELFTRIGRRDWIRKCDGLLQPPQDSNKILHAKVWNNRGTALGQVGKYQKAIECFDKAIEINPEDADAWYNRGEALGQVGKYQKAIECFDKAIEINPNYINALNSKGTALHYLDEYQKAIECYDKAIEINPEDADAWCAKGLSLTCLKNYQKAIEECFDKAIEINPEDADVWYSKGTALTYLTKYLEAIECYDKALDINPDHASAWYGKGTAFRKITKYLEAIECYDKALDINPENAIAWYSKGLALDSLYEHKKAEEYFNKAKELGLAR